MIDLGLDVSRDDSLLMIVLRNPLGSILLWIIWYVLPVYRLIIADRYSLVMLCLLIVRIIVLTLRMLLIVMILLVLKLDIPMPR